MQFVNIHGDPISISVSAKSTSKTPAKRKSEQPQSFHKGWVVTGFSPQHIAEARAEHAKNPPPDGKPFELASYMRTNKPRKVRPKPYALRDAAEQCAEMARRSGWLLVQATPVAKGGE